LGNPLYQVKKISKSYGESCILKDIFFEVNQGEILAIIGGSGAGKSTLLNILSGNIQPNLGGEITVNQEQLNLYFERLIREFPFIKLIPQDFRLKPDYKISENIDLSLTEFSMDYRKERVKYLLELFGLKHLENRKPREVSGGEKQRTAIARAIANEPQVLLLDEPFSNLDAINKNHLRKILLEVIKTEQIACVFVSHDLFDVFGIADKIGVLQNGEMIAIGTVSEIMKSDLPYIKDLIANAFEPVKEFLKSIE
jgi:ABC-type multidrug transport system ATPase subunit